MPRVPTYQPFQVQPSVGPGPAFQAPSGPGPAQISGEQLQQMGGAISEVGEQLGKYAQIQQERINRARFYEVQSELREVFRQEEQGLRSLKGAQLFDSDQPAFEKSRDFLETRRGEILNRLPNQVLRDAFQQEFSRQFEGFNDRMIIYEGEQFELYKSTTQDAAIEGAFRDGVLNVNAREENFGIALNIVRDKVTDEGLTGIGAEEKASELITSMVSDQVDELIRQGRFADAIDLLNSAALTRGIDEIGILAPEGTTGFGAIKEDDLIALRYGVNKAEASFQSIKLASNGDLSGANEVIDGYKDILSEPDIFALQTAASEEKISYDRRQASIGNSNDAYLERRLVEEISRPDVTVDDIRPLVDLLSDPEKALKWINAARSAESQRETGATKDLERASPVLRNDLRRQFQNGNLTEDQARERALEFYGSELLTPSDYAGLLSDLETDLDERKRSWLNIIDAAFAQGQLDFDNMKEVEREEARVQFDSIWSDIQNSPDADIRASVNDILRGFSQARLPGQAMAPPPLPAGFTRPPTQEEIDNFMLPFDEEMANPETTEERKREIRQDQDYQIWDAWSRRLEFQSEVSEGRF